MSRKKTVSKGGPCTKCGRKHPKGKQARAKALKAGTWKGCVVRVKKETSDSGQALTKFEPEKRAAKNATVKERNQQRKEQRKKEAEERNAAWQALSLEQQLEACKKSPYNKAKQINKIKRQIQERDNNNA